MATLKLKKKPPGKQPAASATVRRGPLRPGGAKTPRPTLAQAQAERAKQREAMTEPRPIERRPEPSAAARAEGRDRPGPPRDSPARVAPGTAPPRPPRADPRRPGPSAHAAPRPFPPPRKDHCIAPRPELPPLTPRSAGDAGSMRLSKRMAELGLASRREADEWIELGYVSVDGVVVDQLGARVRTEQRIELDARASMDQAQRVTVLLHKPLGYVSGQAEDGHEPAFTLVTAENRWRGDAHPQRFHARQLKHLVPAGRLDLDSTGLLVLTQDGRVAKALIGEDSKVEKEYVVRVRWTMHPELEALHQTFPDELLARLRHGLQLDGRQLLPAQVSWQNEQHLRIVLREGRKRQIRRMCEAVGLQVQGLKRIRIGRVSLGELPSGQWRYLGPFERF